LKFVRAAGPLTGPAAVLFSKVACNWCICSVTGHVQIQALQAEWRAAGVDDHKSCQDFLQQLGYREYSRCAAVL
jgi:hypothetical protein